MSTSESSDTTDVWPGTSWVPPLSRRGLREGLRAMSPVALAIGVWGLVTGVALVNAGMSTAMALLMTITVFAGSAQLATLPLLMANTPLPIVWITATLVNLRFVIFAAASRRSFSNLPFRQRLVSGYLNGDVGFALFAQRFPDRSGAGTPQQYGFFFGCASMNWLSWQVASIIGILVGSAAPPEWGLELAATTALVAVVVPMVVRMPAVAGVVVTGVASLLTAHWPMRLGLLASVVLGVTAALIAERRGERPPMTEAGAS